MKIGNMKGPFYLEHTDIVAAKTRFYFLADHIILMANLLQDHLHYTCKQTSTD